MTQTFHWRVGVSALWICLVLTSAGPAQIAFVSDRDGNAETYVTDADGDNLKNPTKHPAYDVPSGWSPDGMKIAFHSGRHDAKWKST